MKSTKVKYGWTSAKFKNNLYTYDGRPFCIINKIICWNIVQTLKKGQMNKLLRTLYIMLHYASVIKKVDSIMCRLYTTWLVNLLVGWFMWLIYCRNLFLDIELYETTKFVLISLLNVCFDDFVKYCFWQFRRNSEFCMEVSVGRLTLKSHLLSSSSRVTLFEICSAKLTWDFDGQPLARGDADKNEYEINDIKLIILLLTLLMRMPSLKCVRIVDDCC